MSQYKLIAIDNNDHHDEWPLADETESQIIINTLEQNRPAPINITTEHGNETIWFNPAGYKNWRITKTR